jgi:hypothetical protein
MKTYLGLLLGSLYLLAPGAASAQLPRSRPAVSPYLNLLQGTQGAGLNYYNLVRPEIEYRSAIDRLQQQGQTTQQALTDLQSGALPATGHFAGFMTQGNYFQSFTGGPAGSSYGGAAGSSYGGAAGSSFGTLGGMSGRGVGGTPAAGRR